MMTSLAGKVLLQCIKGDTKTMTRTKTETKTMAKRMTKTTMTMTMMMTSRAGKVSLQHIKGDTLSRVTKLLPEFSERDWQEGGETNDEI